MTRSLLADAFGHHAWANLQILDACRVLTPDQLASAVPGTFGSILDTLRHIVGADAGYLNLLTEGRVARIEDEGALGLDELRNASVGHGEAWAALLEGDLDPSVDVVRHRDDGSKGGAPLGVRLAQAIHHGTDHRSQVCTALTMLGIEPPEIDVWAYAWQDGRLWETPAED
jgi:uncharacterized damage-inducible protein DinB